MVAPGRPQQADRRTIDRLLSIRMGIALGSLLAVATSVGLALRDRDTATIIATAAMVVAFAVYVALARERASLVVESSVLMLGVVIAVLGLVHHPAWIAGGFVAHGFWDLMHAEHRRRPSLARAPRWYPPACAVYDWIVAVAILALL